ncbi:MAG: glycosyltransferase [Candidatus Melainabacteria bacterium]|nr:glycosyltransferase [Candidatus Melainabacteria bacterium]
MHKTESRHSVLSTTAEKFKDFYETNFARVRASMTRNKYYYSLKESALVERIPKGLKILEIGCWTGDLLNKLNPSYGVGIDLCGKAVALAKEKYTSSNFKFIEGDFCSQETRKLIGNQKFDVIVIVNTIGQIHDVVSFLKILHEFCHARTRIHIYSYSRFWEPLYYLGEVLGLKVKSPEENWLPPEELKQMFYLSELQEIHSSSHLLFPFYIPLVSKIINQLIAHLPFLENLCMIIGFTLRPFGEKYTSELPKSLSCSVIIPSKNEAGHIRDLVKRLPDLGEWSEYIFIEGNSTDNTEDEIRAAIMENPDKPLRLVKQKGKGKGDAVRLGFSKASGDILAILDADITIAPEDLPRFIEILTENKAEFVNGSRMVYPMEENAMRFLNIIANKFFAYAFSFLLGCQIRDTLCGTKVLWRKDYEMIARTRSYFGDFDPFGDFDLIFGANRLHLKIIDFPVRYSERTYGKTNISRFKHGLLLLQMSLFAFRKIKMV